MPTAGSQFSQTQIERLSQYVAERRKASAAIKTLGGTVGGQATRSPDAAGSRPSTVGGTQGSAVTRDGDEKSIGGHRAGTTVGGRAESEGKIETRPGDGAPRTASRSADLSAAVAMLELEDGFEVMKVLGEGGMGSVIHAVEKSSGRQVAIKRLLSEGTSPKLLNQLVSEYRATLQLSHPNIVRSYNVYRDSKGPYFSMEYVEGKTLQDRLSEKNAKLSVQEAFEIFVPLADALAHAHSGKKPVVHRDIKPANILLTKGGMAKLADFGIAMEGESSSQNADFVGTVKFMAPEQYVDSRNCNHLSDQYSFAATIYFALTRLPPKDFNPKKVPAAFREFLTRAMQEAPYKRFPSTAEMAQALRESAPDSVVNKSDSSEQGLDLRIFFGGLAVCLVLVAGIVAMVMKKPEPQPIAMTPTSTVERPNDSTEVSNPPVTAKPAEPEIVAAPPAPPEDWPPKGIMPGEAFSMEEAVAQATSQKKAIFLYWWKESSDECKQMHLETFKDPTVLSSLAERFVILRIDAEKDTTTGANILQPSAFPAFAVVDAASNQVLAKSPPDRAAYMDAATLSVWIRQVTQSLVTSSGNMTDIEAATTSTETIPDNRATEEYFEDFRNVPNWGLPDGWVQVKTTSNVLLVRQDAGRAHIRTTVAGYAGGTGWEGDGSAGFADRAAARLPPIALRNDFFFEMTVLSNEPWTGHRAGTRGISLTLKNTDEDKLVFRSIEDSTGFVGFLPGSPESLPFSLAGKNPYRFRLERKGGTYLFRINGKVGLTHEANDHRPFDVVELELTPKIMVGSVKIGPLNEATEEKDVPEKDDSKKSSRSKRK